MKCRKLLVYEAKFNMMRNVTGAHNMRKIEKNLFPSTWMWFYSNHFDISALWDFPTQKSLNKSFKSHLFVKRILSFKKELKRKKLN